MSLVARQSTALELAIGPVLDADGVAVTGGVVGDFKIKKTTGNFAALNGSATLTHVSAGIYDLVLTTSDTDTVGLCCIAIDDTVNACASVYLQVIEEAVYDILFAASATGAVPVASIANGAITAAAIATDAIDDDAISTDAIAAINATVDTALSDVGLTTTRTGYLDNLSAGAVATAAKLLAYFQSALRSDVTVDADIGGTYDDATDSQQAIRDRGDAAWITATGFSTHSAADVWAAGTRSLTVLDEDSTTLDLDATIRAAVGLASANLDTQLDALPTTAEVNAEVDTALADYDAPTNAEMVARTLAAASYATATALQTVDDEIATIDSNVDAILADTGTDGVVVATASKTGYRLSSTGVDDVLDEAIGDSTITMRQALKLAVAALAGKLSGAATTTVTIRNAADDTNVVVATVDADGNRSAVTLSL